MLSLVAKFASKRRLRRKQCENKRAYGSDREAWDAVQAMRSSQPGNDHLVVYRCRFAGTRPHWHLGHRSLARSEFPAHGKDRKVR